LIYDLPYSLILNAEMNPLILLTKSDLVSSETIDKLRETLSDKLKMDVTHIPYLECYHFPTKLDPLDSKERDFRLEQRCLKFLQIALKLGDEQLKLTAERKLW
jgi:hypothetical protein